MPSEVKSRSVKSGNVSNGDHFERKSTTNLGNSLSPFSSSTSTSTPSPNETPAGSRNSCFIPRNISRGSNGLRATSATSSGSFVGSAPDARLLDLTSRTTLSTPSSHPFAFPPHSGHHRINSSSSASHHQTPASSGYFALPSGTGAAYPSCLSSGWDQTCSTPSFASQQHPHPHPHHFHSSSGQFALPFNHFPLLNEDSLIPGAGRQGVAGHRMPPNVEPVLTNGARGAHEETTPSQGQHQTQPTRHSRPRRRLATMAQRRAANNRERKRMNNLNSAFDVLRKKVPTFAYEKRLSRIETLRLTIGYISFMADVVRGLNEPPPGPQRVPFQPNIGSSQNLYNGENLWQPLPPPSP